MKTTSIIIIILAFVFNLQGYSQIKKADKQLELYNYSKAIPFLLEAAQSNDIEAKNKAIPLLANCYRLTNNIGEARVWYEKAVELEGADPINYFYLGQAYRGLGLYKEAAGAFHSYQNASPDSLNAGQYRQYCTDIEEWLKLPPMAEIKNVESVNTRFSEFCPAFDKNGIVFASDRKVDKMVDTYGWTNFSYLDLYYAQPEYFKNFWSPLTPPVELENNFNQAFHDGPAVFTSDFSRVYVTKTDEEDVFKEKGNMRTSLLKIFYADIKDGKKLKFESLPFNNKNYSVAHPALSNNNQRMIFSSDMPGGFGGSDLYISTLENDKWSTPVNLGETINTIGDEVFPYWANDSVLFYSSDGHMGYGGLDIFQTNFADGSWHKPENLKAPINSSYDDFGIIFNENLKDGLFSSNRPEGKGADDIYAFRGLKKMPAKLMANGYVKEKYSKQPILNAVVFLLNEATQEVLILKSDVNGYFEGMVDRGTPYVVKAVKNSYIEDCFSYKTTTDEKVTKQAMPRDLLLSKLEVNRSFQVENIYYNLDKWFIRDDAKPSLDNLVEIMSKYPISAELSSHTDSRASKEYNTKLSQKRAESAIEYIVKKGIDAKRLTAKGYGEMKLVNQCADGVTCTEPQHQENRRTEFKITSVNLQWYSDNDYNPELFNHGQIIRADTLEPKFFNDCFSNNEVLKIQNSKGGITKMTESKSTDEVKTDQKDQSSSGQKVKPVNEPEIIEESTLEKNQNPVPSSVTSNNELASVVYRVQILAVGKPVDIDSYFSKISDIIKKYDISENIVNGIYKYQIGNFVDKNQMVELKKVLIERGFKDCFVVLVER